MASREDLWNTALGAIGHDVPIISADEETTAAQMVRSIDDKVRRMVLAAHTWNFCATRARLARMAEVPANAWAYYFILPGDYVRKIELRRPDSDRDIDDYAEESLVTPRSVQRVIASNEKALILRYVADNTAARDPNMQDAGFQEAYIALLARDLSLPLTQSATNYQLMQDRYDRAITKARTLDAMNDAPLEMPIPSWIYGRHR